LWDICFSVGSRIADLQGITSYSIKKTQHCKMILIALCILLCIRSSLCVLSCSDILQSHPEFYGHDGVYKLNDDELYCDMTTDGGGWTLIAYAKNMTLCGPLSTGCGYWSPSSGSFSTSTQPSYASALLKEESLQVAYSCLTKT